MENRFGTFGDNDPAKGLIFNQRISEIGNELIDEHNDHTKDYTLQVPYAGTTTGTANTYAIATPTITALTVGMAVSVKFNLDSTAASTLNWCGLGAKPIKKANGTNVTNLKATGIYTLRYDGTNFILQGEGASGNATASDLISGKTATVDAGEITGTLALTGNAPVGNVLSGSTFYATDPKTKLTGTMANRGAVAITPSTTNQAIAAGYHNGSGYVAGDADLIAGNIINGVNIFGVTGNVNKPYANLNNFSALSSLPYTNVAVSKNHIYAVHSGNLIKLDPSTGSLLSSFPISRNASATIDVTNEEVVNCGSTGQSILIYNLAGTLLRTINIPSDFSPWLLSCNTLVYAGHYASGNYYPYLIKKDGTVLGYSTDYPVDSLSRPLMGGLYAYYTSLSGSNGIIRVTIPASAGVITTKRYLGVTNALFQHFFTIGE